MRILSLVVWLLILTQAVQADQAACKALFHDAPTSLGGYLATGHEEHETSSRGAGYSVQFRKDSSEVATAFFFDRGQDRFSERFLATELSVAASNIYRLREKGQNVSDGDVYFDRPDTATRGLFGLAFVHLVFDRRVRQHDYITLGVIDRCMVKLIYSTDGSKRAANRKFNQVLGDLLAHLNAAG